MRMTFGMDGCDDLHFSQKGSDTVYAADGRMVLSTPIATTGVTKTIVSSQVPIVQVYTICSVCPIHPWNPSPLSKRLFNVWIRFGELCGKEKTNRIDESRTRE